MRRIMLLSWVVAVCTAAQAGEIRFDKAAYAGWPNCLRLTNGEVELVATTDVGPRIIRFGFVGGQNLFKEYGDQVGTTESDTWCIYGGHRFWHAPEMKPRTYSLDNAAIEYEWDGTTLKLIQPTEEDNRVQKTIEVTLDADRNHVRLVHRLVNRNPWAIELAPWALTVMAQGGRAVFPQEPYRPHTEYLLPARPLVLWHYTDMADARWTWGTKYIQLQQDPAAATPQKLGLKNSQGWVAYLLKGEVFIKRYHTDAGATLPDFGCNTESFTNGDMLEIETVGPLITLDANGGEVEHVEHWFLFRAEVGRDESSIDGTLLPLVRQTDQVVTPTK